jgi:hypothetical protein
MARSSRRGYAFQQLNPSFQDNEKGISVDLSAVGREIAFEAQPRTNVR